MLRSAGAIPVAETEKSRLEHFVEDVHTRFLNDLVFDRLHAQRALPPVVFFDLHAQRHCQAKLDLLALLGKPTDFHPRLRASHLLTPATPDTFLRYPLLKSDKNAAGMPLRRSNVWLIHPNKDSSSAKA